MQPHVCVAVFFLTGLCTLVLYLLRNYYILITIFLQCKMDGVLSSFLKEKIFTKMIMAIFFIHFVWPDMEVSQKLGLMKCDAYVVFLLLVEFHNFLRPRYFEQ